ncbi:MAG TPA: ribonuclease H-like domain-containing protein [Afifellaceae bacterium]|nr:ribonuclease H-like domain-containing protein [Afifellaceae bacterium]
MTITLHQGDLPDGVDFGAAVAVDTETLGLRPHRDRLCLVQLSAGDGSAHLVQMPQEGIEAPNLRRLLTDPDVQKIFHFARFDLAVLEHALGVMAEPVFCTKVASKLARTYTDRHSLKDLTRELLGIELSKLQQSSDWGASELSQAQLEYAAADVLHLHALRDRLREMLEREGRTQLAEACFAFLSTRARLDLAGFLDDDILAH